MTTPSTGSIAVEILKLLRKNSARLQLPRVRALHLPPSPWNGSKDGEFSALELEDGSMGLGYVLLDNTLAELHSSPTHPGLLGADVLEVAEWWVSKTGAQRMVGFAAVNALTRHLFDLAGYEPPTASDSIGGLAPQSGEHIGMVGFFPPLLKQAAANGARLTVLELRTDLAGNHDGYRVTLDVQDLGSCDKVLLTSTVLLNDSLDNVLAHCQSAGSIAMIGPGAGCLPEPLFCRGIGLVGGFWINDNIGFRNALRLGTRWGEYGRKFAITEQNYPGILQLAGN